MPMPEPPPPKPSDKFVIRQCVEAADDVIEADLERKIRLTKSGKIIRPEKQEQEPEK